MLKSKPLFILFVLVLQSSLVLGQYKLIFEHPEIEKTYEVRDGDYLKLRYMGYVDQETEVENFIQEITPAYVLYTPPLGKNKYGDDQVVMVEDITGFRRMSKLRPMMPSIASLGVGIGIYYAIGVNDQFSDTQQLFYSLGASLGTGILIQWLFKTDIKLKISDGWTVRVVSSPYQQ